jgi:hypothetical protein
MFPDPCGSQFAEAAAKGVDPAAVVPDEYVILRGGASSSNSPGETFSGAAGPNLEAAAAAVPHGQIRVTTAGAIRAQGGIVQWAPEISRHGTLNQQHVNVTETGPTTFSALQPNPVSRVWRIDGDKK